MSTIIFLCRHAEYANPFKVNPSRLPGFFLSEAGIKQAQDLANYFLEQKISVIYSSPLERTQQTADIVASKLNLKVYLDKRLIEVRSVFEGKPLSYVDSVNPYIPKHLSEGGESLTELFVRMNDFIDEKIRQHRGLNILAISHGDPIMSLVTKYQGNPLVKTEIDKDYIGKGKGYRLEFDADNNFKNLTMIFGH